LPLCGALLGLRSPAPPDSTGPAESLEVVEERTEEIANRLLDASAALRAGDAEALARFFSDPTLLRPLPREAGRPAAVVKWIQRHDWTLPPDGASSATPVQAAGQWQALLRHFSAIDDVRFQLVSAEFTDPATARAEALLALVGRDGEGHREWLRGTLSLGLVRGTAEEWLIRELSVTRLGSLVSATELFSEIGALSGAGAPPERQTSSISGFGGSSGAAVGDVDQDGFVDLFVTAKRRNYLLVNDGHGKFSDRAADAKVRDTPEAQAPLLVDVDNDGDSDLFLTSRADPQMLFENRLVPDGRLEFRDVSLEAGVARATNGRGAAASDVNGDGLTDIFVAGYSAAFPPQNPYFATDGAQNLLFVNQGGGRFREMAEELGLADRERGKRMSFGAEFADLDGDGDQDLYVVNDFSENVLYRNELKETGRLGFRDVTREAGVDLPNYGMGVSFGDYNNDGILDIHATNMSSVAGHRVFDRMPRDPPLGRLRKLAEGNFLFEGLGKGAFRDVSAAAGPFEAGWAWGGGFVDLDNDGWQDLHSTNGFVSMAKTHDVSSRWWRHLVDAAQSGVSRMRTRAAWRRIHEPMRSDGLSWSGHERDAVYLNLGTGRYLDISGVSGLDSPTDGRVPIYADFDDDGDLDILLATLEEERFLFRNNVGQDARWIRVALEGSRCGRDAFGAVVRVVTSAGVQTKVKSGGEGYLSQHDPRLLFGLGADRLARSVEVTWPSGQKQRYDNVPAGTYLKIVEGDEGKPGRR
jgi:ketosteroid isomerase-like protein